MTNTVTLTGNLTRDPELRYTPDGLASASFGLAVTRRWQSRAAAGTWEEATSFFDVVCWRDMAENVAFSLQKGTRVMVAGRMEQRTWETKEGDKRHKTEVVAEEVGPSLRFAAAEVMRTSRETHPGQEGDSGSPSGSKARAVTAPGTCITESNGTGAPGEPNKGGEPESCDEVPGERIPGEPDSSAPEQSLRSERASKKSARSSGSASVRGDGGDCEQASGTELIGAGHGSR